MDRSFTALGGRPSGFFAWKGQRAPGSIGKSFVWFIAALALLGGMGTGWTQNATPISVTGWNTDLIFEVTSAGNASTIGGFFDELNAYTWAESGVITGKSVNGLPSSRTFTSAASSSVTGGATLTQFQFQPYNAANSLNFASAGSATLTLTTPAKYKRLSVLNVAASAHGNLNWFTVTLHFTDHEAVTVLSQVFWNGLSTFPATDWGVITGGTAILADRVGHSRNHSATDEDPLTGTQGGFGMGEAVIDLSTAPFNVQQYTLSAVDFYKPYGASDATAAIFALSGVASVQVNAAPTVVGQPATQAKCEGDSATFTASATGSPTPTVQWQVSTNGGGSFSNVAGQTTTTLSFTTALAQSGNQYRAVFTNSSGAATTNAAALTVNAIPGVPTITPNPASVFASSVGNLASGPAGAAGYAWSITNGTITSATNTASVTYTAGATGNVTLSLTVSNATGCGASNSTNIVINPPPAQPSVTLQPSTQAKCDNEFVTFTAGATGGPVPTIQWQVKTPTGSFSNLAGQTSGTLTLVASLALSGNQYRAVFTNTNGFANSNAATLTVNAVPDVPIITALPASVFANSTGNLASGPAGVAAYQWSITNGTLTSAANLPAIIYTAGPSGNVTLTLTVSNATGCGATTSINLAIHTLPPSPNGPAGPIALNGWNKDLIFEVPAVVGAASAIDQFFDAGSQTTWAQTGVITGKTINGLPTSRLITSAAYTDATQTALTNTQFGFQPYTGANAAYLGTSGTVTLNLLAPTKYKILSFLHASSSQGMKDVRVTLGFTDHAAVNVDLFTNSLGQPVTFTCTDWGTAPYTWDGAISIDRVGHSSSFSATAADPLSGTQPGFGMAEARIDLSQAPYALSSSTLSSITFTKPASSGGAVGVVFAVSGTPTSIPATSPIGIPSFAAGANVAFTTTGLTVGKGYIVQRSTDLLTWIPVDTFAADTGSKSWSEPRPSGDKLFYRVTEY